MSMIYMILFLYMIAGLNNIECYYNIEYCLQTNYINKEIIFFILFNNFFSIHKVNYQ